MSALPVTIDELAQATREITEAVVWCTVATVDSADNPRTRLMHPVWFWEDREVPVGLVTARTTPIKLRHLARRPTVSCFYWDPAHHTVAIDAVATWLDHDARAEAWTSIAAVPPPVGFDPAVIWPDGPDSPDCGILHLHPFRIVTTRAGQPASMWRQLEPRAVEWQAGE